MGDAFVAAEPTTPNRPASGAGMPPNASQIKVPHIAYVGDEDVHVMDGAKKAQAEAATTKAPPATPSSAVTAPPSPRHPNSFAG